MSRGPAWTQTPRTTYFTSDNELGKRADLRLWLEWEARQPLMLGCWGLLDADERAEIRLVIRSAKKSLSWR